LKQKLVGKSFRAFFKQSGIRRRNDTSNGTKLPVHKWWCKQQQNDVAKPPMVVQSFSCSEIRYRPYAILPKSHDGL